MTQRAAGGPTSPSGAGDNDKDSAEGLRKELDRRQQYIDSLLVQMDSQKDEFIQQLDALANERDKLRQELVAVQHYKREKIALEAEVQRLRDSEAALRLKNQKELSKLKYQGLEEKVRLKNEELAMEQRFHQNVETRAYELLDAKTKAIHQQNKELLEDKLLLERELEELMGLKKQRDDEFKSKQRDLELHEEGLQQAAKQGCQLNREVKELRAKNAKLEESLKANTHKFEQERADRLKSYEEKLALREKQIAEAHHLLEIRTQELHRMRGLAQHIVEARSELEAFFNEALEYVKQQMLLEDAPATQKTVLKTKKSFTRVPGSKSATALFISTANTSTSASTSDGGLGATPPYTPDSTDSDFLAGFEPLAILSNQSSDGDSLPPISPTIESRRPPARHVDISELSWADKERVLRILFAKINVQGKPLGKKKGVNHVPGATSFRTHI